jgi:hypothetical protein
MRKTWARKNPGLEKIALRKTCLNYFPFSLVLSFPSSFAGGCGCFFRAA